MRVLHVDSGREYRGGQNQVRLLTRELARQADVQQRVITRRGSELSRRVTAAGVLVRDVPWTLAPAGASWSRRSPGGPTSYTRTTVTPSPSPFGRADS